VASPFHNEGGPATGAIKPSSTPVTEIPSYWFSLMESAAGRGDFDAAARAKRELERLGVRVVFTRRRGRQGGARAS
jgi:hypothetical protein